MSVADTVIEGSQCRAVGFCHDLTADCHRLKKLDHCAAVVFGCGAQSFEVLSEKLKVMRVLLFVCRSVLRLEQAYEMFVVLFSGRTYRFQWLGENATVKILEVLRYL
jgi:hypothetical protein